MSNAIEFRLDDDEIQQDPYAFYPGLRENVPVLRTDMGGSPCWVLSRHDDIATALKDTETFSSRTAPAPNVLTSDPPDQQRLRKAVADLFTRSTVESMAPFIAARTSELLSPLAAAGRADIVDEFAAPLTVSVISHLLGITVDDIEQLRDLTRLRAEHVRAVRRGAQSTPEAQAANVALSALAKDIVASGRFASESVVDRLAGLQDQGELTEEECAEYVVLLLVAGHTTTTNLIANAVYILSQRPGDLDRLRENPEFAPAFVEEVLRTRPSFQRIVRVTNCDVVLSGETIPAGAMVYFLLGSANRDPLKIERPDEFDADRRRAPHMTFGHGIHTCLGQWLARLEARTALAALAENVSRIEIGPELGPQHLAGGTGNEFGFEHLPVRLHGRGRADA